MLQQLQWSTLAEQRKSSSLILLFKVKYQLIAVNPTHYLTPMVPSITRSYHPDKFQPLPARLKLYENSFFPRTVTWWNDLSKDALAASLYEDVEVFKEAVQCSKLNTGGAATPH